MVSFEARRLSRAPGWYVRAAWPNGRRDHIPGFISEDEALRWIEQKGGAWVNDASVSETGWRSAPRREFSVLPDIRHAAARPTGAPRGR